MTEQAIVSHTAEQMQLSPMMLLDPREALT